MTMSDRGIHPDLLEEEHAAAEAAPEPQAPAPRGRRRERAAPVPPVTESAAPAAAPEDSPADASVGTETEAPPDWREQIKDVTDPQAALATLLKTVPIAELEKHPTVAGWIGDMSRKRAQQLIRQQQQDELERQKREALANRDYYGLGQQVAQELQGQVQQEQMAQASAPFMEGVTRFQSKLPEQVQQQLSGKQYGVGKSHAEGVEEYLTDTVERLVSHRLAEAVEAEMKKREPAIRKAVLSGTNGTAQVPELDGGPSQSVREITDDQIAAMTLSEYNQYFDESGRPKPGVRVRLNRAIDVTRQQH